MKKTIAAMVYLSYLAFGVPAHADETSSSAVQAAAQKDAVKGEEKAQRAADRALSRKVLVSLSRTKGLTPVNITVLVRHGVVSLTGYVPDSEQVQLAGDTAAGVAGVRSVANNLVPGAPGG